MSADEAPVQIATIVEGHGEVAAVPILIRRIAAGWGYYPKLLTPHRVPKAKMLALDPLARAARLQLAKAGPGCGLLVLVDADDDEPARLLETVRAGVPASAQTHVCIAVREFEAWFLASVRALRTHRDVKHDAWWPSPEQPGDAKGAMQSQMHTQYRVMIHQPAFANLIDVTVARERSPSFDAFCVALQSILGVAPDTGPGLPGP